MSFILGAETASVAFLAALLPALFWLLFWLREDRKKPEPRQLILLAFLTGMGAVIFVLPLQALAAQYIPTGYVLIAIWAIIEELTKLGLAWITVLRRSAVDEPVDIPTYLITVALGFAALENTFFLFRPVAEGKLLGTIVTGDLRFIGATLLHVLASSIIGTAIALVYYSERREKIIYAIGGVILAIFLHASFNFFIISTGTAHILTIFMGVWVGIVCLLLGFEKVKNVERPEWWKKTFMKRNA